MKNCTHCKFARWTRTAAGRLHPSGDGLCDYPYQLPPLPSSMRWFVGVVPAPIGGNINRKRDHASHCKYYARAA